MATGTPAAVEDYMQVILEGTRLADDLPVEVEVEVEVEVADQPDARKLLIIRELPTVDVIPVTVTHTYVRSRDEVVAKARPAKDIHQRYANLVGQLVLRSMWEAFQVQPASLIDEIAVNGHASCSRPWACSRGSRRRRGTTVWTPSPLTRIRSWAASA